MAYGMSRVLFHVGFLRQFPPRVSPPLFRVWSTNVQMFKCSHLLCVQNPTSITWPPTWASSSAPTAPSATPPPTHRPPLLRPAANAPAARGRPPPPRQLPATPRTLRQATSAEKADGPSRCARHLPSSATEAAEGVVDCYPCQRQGPRLVTDGRPLGTRPYLLGKRYKRRRRPQWPGEQWASSEQCGPHSPGCA